MNSVIQRKVATTDRNKYLLHTGDFMEIETGDGKYLFLSETLQFFKVANPSVGEYLRLCRAADTENTSLTPDEIKNIGGALSRKPIVAEVAEPQTPYNFLILNLTNSCNLACKYCFAETAAHGKTMSLDVAKQAVINMLNHADASNGYSIYFFGGEPLMKKELVRQITAFAYDEIVVKLGKKVNFLLNTNGTLITREIAEFFHHYHFKVTISLDGHKAYHNSNRVYHSGKGSFDQVMQGLETLKSQGVNTDCRATLSPETGDLVSLFRFFESLQVPYTCSFTLPSKYKSNREVTLFDTDKLASVENELKKVMDFFYQKLLIGEPFYYTGLNHGLLTLKHKKIRTHSCEAGRGSMTVDEEGHYYACQNMIPYKESVLGNITEGISAEKQEKYGVKNLSALAHCHSCPIRNLCAGGCEVQRLYDDENAKNQMCRLFLLEWKNRLYLYAKIKNIQKQ